MVVLVGGPAGVGVFAEVGPGVQHFFGELVIGLGEGVGLAVTAVFVKKILSTRQSR